MTDATNRYNALVKKTFDMLYSLCEGQKKTHSDLIKHQGEYAKMWDNYNKTVQWHIES